MARRFAAGVAVGAAVAVSLAGCGSSGGTKNADGSHTNAQLTAAQEITQVSQRAATITSFKANLTASGTVLGKPLHIRGDLLVQTKPQFEMAMNMPDVQAGGQAVTGGMSEIMTGDAIYLKIAALTNQTGGKPWMELSLSAIKQQTGLDIQGLLSQAEQADPATNIKMFTSSANARKVGTDTIDGVQTTHYQGTYSMQQALAKLTPAERQLVQQSAGQMTFDLWVDGQNLPRKMVLSAGAGATTQMNVTATYSDFNQPVTISAPPASEIAPAPQLPSFTG